jgi:F-type H+-transporting ATPase subunit epsilon
MPTSFHLSIVAPDRSVVEEPVVSVVAPGTEGYFGVMASHVPFVTALKPGLVEYETASGHRHYVAVSGGFLEMDGKKATVLADAAELEHEIDVAKAEEQLAVARATLRGEDTGMTAEEATVALDHAMNRLKAAKKA